MSPEVLRQGNLPYLTNLTFIWEQNDEAEAWQALLSLPKLKVQPYEQSRFKKREFFMLFEFEYPILICKCAALAGSRGGLVEVLNDVSS